MWYGNNLSGTESFVLQCWGIGVFVGLSRGTKYPNIVRICGPNGELRELWSVEQLGSLAHFEYYIGNVYSVY